MALLLWEPTSKMIKWFAPLLVFAAKPELLLRALTLAVAGGILAFGVWLLSNVAVTFDSLKNTYIAIIYAAVLACFFIGVGIVTWLRVRRLADTAKPHPAISAPEAPPLSNEIVSRRAEAISRKWLPYSGRGSERLARTALAPTTVPTPPLRHVAEAVRGSFIVTGPAFSGKTSLIATLVRETTDEMGDIVRLVDAGSIDGADRSLELLLSDTATANGVLFVVDQDLRAPEAAAISRLMATGKPLWVVLNKADHFGAADRDAILVSIRAKMPAKFPPGRVVSVTAAPSAVEREIEDARGGVRLELRRPPSDVQTLISLIGGVLAVPTGKSLKFEAA